MPGRIDGNTVLEIERRRVGEVDGAFGEIILTEQVIGDRVAGGGENRADGSGYDRDGKADRNESKTKTTNIHARRVARSDPGEMCFTMIRLM